MPQQVPSMRAWNAYSSRPSLRRLTARRRRRRSGAPAHAHAHPFLFSSRATTMGVETAFLQSRQLRVSFCHALQRGTSTNLQCKFVLVPTPTSVLILRAFDNFFVLRKRTRAWRRRRRRRTRPPRSPSSRLRAAPGRRRAWPTLLAHAPSGLAMPFEWHSSAPNGCCARGPLQRCGDGQLRGACMLAAR